MARSDRRIDFCYRTAYNAFGNGEAMPNDEGVGTQRVSPTRVGTQSFAKRIKMSAGLFVIGFVGVLGSVLSGVLGFPLIGSILTFFGGASVLAAVVNLLPLLVEGPCPYCAFESATMRSFFNVKVCCPKCRKWFKLAGGKFVP
jgi:hypothetical protein